MPKWVQLPADWSHSHVREVWVNLDRVDYIEFWNADGQELVALNGVASVNGRSADATFVREVRDFVQGRGGTPPQSS